MKLCSLLTVACIGGSPQARATISALANCQPVAAFGAVPDDTLDDRAALQLALDAGCLDLRGAPGRYDVVTPAWPRPMAMLEAPADAQILGDGNASLIAFSGDPAQQDLFGVWLRSPNVTIRNVRFEMGELPAGRTNEQTHVIRVDGPIDGVLIDGVTCDHPLVPGSSRGDCIQLVGYAPDRLVRNVTIRRLRVERSGRSGVGWHSGVRGLTIEYSTFVDVSDQALDGEGNDIEPLVVGAEIHHNMFLTGPAPQGGLTVAIFHAEQLRFHHNSLLGRGAAFDGCSQCESDHNTVVQTVPTGDAAVLVRKNTHGMVLHHERYTRAETAGPGPVLTVQQRTSAPRDVTVRDTVLTQQAPGTVLYAQGIVGLHVEDVQIVNESASTGWFGIDFAGTAGALGIRTTDLHVLDTAIVGPALRAAIRLSGAYAGAGTLEVRHLTSAHGLRCEATTTQGTILGPVTWADSAAPAATCGTVEIRTE